MMAGRLGHDPFHVVICGIGGQGNILASELLGAALVENGYAVTIGETYGASQRGGSVMSHIRITEKRELGVLIPDHEAHIVVGFEPLETLRIVRRYANSETIAVYDDRAAYPLGVLGGEMAYPPVPGIAEELGKRCKKALVVPAAAIALSAGDGKAANIALLGALTALGELPLTKENFVRTLAQRFTGDVLRMNRTVFQLGADALASRLAEGGSGHGR